MKPDHQKTSGRAIKERLITGIWFFCAIFAVIAVSFILFFLLYNGYPALAQTGLWDFLFGGTWNPVSSPPQFGVLPLTVGTVLVTFGALLIAVPLGIGSAIFIAELAPPKLKAFVKPAIEILAGIPSVVYGFFGLIVLTDWLRVTFDVPSGSSWLAGSILLGIMALPTIVSVAEDAISAVPNEFREASLALGGTKWQTISRTVIPSALSGITAAVILGVGRAIGETMAVMMVAGNAAIIPSPLWNVLSPIRTLTATLGIEMGEVGTGTPHYFALFGVALVLLVITLVVNFCATIILGSIRRSQTGGGGGRHLVSFKQKERIISIITWVIGAVLVTVSVLIGGFMAGALFLAIIALVIFSKEKLSPRYAQFLAFSILTALVMTVIFILGVILYDIISKGIPAISWQFLTQAPSDLGRAGGIFPAIVGTLYLVAGAILIALPIGIGAAIYLTEYTREGRLTSIIRTGVDLLNGTPSIVFGLFGLAFLVLFIGFGISLIAGQITLALMVLPTIIRTTEEALRSVPQTLREGSLALGATRWQTIRRVVMPPAIPGIITGTILSIGRAAGETAPILFTAAVFSKRFLPSSLFEPVMALPYHLFVLATNVPGSATNKYGTALVLLLLVIGIYSVAIAIRHHYGKMTHG
jgi:phosphate transport system permease protein